MSDSSSDLRRLLNFAAAGHPPSRRDVAALPCPPAVARYRATVYDAAHQLAELARTGQTALAKRTAREYAAMFAPPFDPHTWSLRADHDTTPSPTEGGRSENPALAAPDPRASQEFLSLRERQGRNGEARPR